MRHRHVKLLAHAPLMYSRVFADELGWLGEDLLLLRLGASDSLLPWTK
jgi:hypothetical protein